MVLKKNRPKRGSPPSNLRESFGSCQKSAQNRGCFWRAKSEKWGKTQKKISKIFIVPNRPLGHTDQLYTYKGHIEYVGFTEKRHKLSKLAILPVKKLMEQNWSKFFDLRHILYWCQSRFTIS